MVCAELNLESIFCQSGLLRHDTSVIHQDIQAIVLGTERFGGLFNGGKRGEIELEVFDKFDGTRYSGYYSFHCIFVLLFGSGAEVDFGGGMLGQMDETFIA